MKQTRTNFERTAKEFQYKLARWDRTLTAFPLLFQALESEEVYADFDADGELAIRFTGKAELMHKVWRHLRIAGFEPSSRPGEKDIASFKCFWYPKDDSTVDEGARYSTIWFSWSNSVCKIKQVGVRKVEREEAVYEYDCGGQTPLGELLGSENDNPSVREG